MCVPIFRSSLVLTNFAVFHIDTLYVDLSRYNGSPVAKVRSHMKYWMDKAAWHKPSVLVLDNIDKLMGTELEVRFACRFVPPKTERV